MTDQPDLSDVLAAADKALDEARTGTAIAAALAPPAPTLPYNTHTATLWRQLDEQRQHFNDVAAEYAAEIAVLTRKRDDALHAVAMAVAGMRIMEDGVPD